MIEELHLPPLVYPVFGLCVGYPDPDKPAAIKPRLPQDVVLYRETYAVPEQEAQSIENYDRAVAAFYQELGLNTPKWSRQMLERLKSIDALHGRERVAQVLKDQGFNLR
ncbi:hypothetical protein KRX52_20215 [Pseudomonas sp. MAP12]|uniref:Nitroreductase domain-containing protein n=1 Tax=Geopseudomonas aromaticivorans TaxID=2849492 RepID=A0ABS6N3A3_9GAMM|nr:hypothetical protein [Pseudomonas aromaticivorans]MBV2135101.1 hypothetical protein [Pseudomonas aromaticivorans]